MLINLSKFSFHTTRKNPPKTELYYRIIILKLLSYTNGYLFDKVRQVKEQFSNFHCYEFIIHVY